LKRNLLIVISAFTLIFLSSVISITTFYSIRKSFIKHDTNRWAVIEDVEGSIIAVESNDDEVWAQLVSLKTSEERMFIGSIVEQYNNKWGFRFTPSNLTIAEVTAEGLQANIRYISENLDYWLGSWAYTSAIVIEIHQ